MDSRPYIDCQFPWTQCDDLTEWKKNQLIKNLTFDKIFILL